MEIVVEDKGARQVRMFLWRLARQSLPTEDVRAHRNMSTTSCCALCRAADSWRHPLLECTMERCVWALVDGDLAEHLCKNNESECKIKVIFDDRYSLTWIFCQVINEFVGDMVGKETCD